MSEPIINFKQSDVEILNETIKQLQAKADRYREALEEIKQVYPEYRAAAYQAIDIATKALQEG